jgi:hypothetical protein
VALELAGLLVVNAGYALVGAALLAVAGQLTWPRLGVALPLGLVAVVVPASYIALLGVPVGGTASLAGAAIVAVAVARTRPWKRLPRAPLLRRPTVGEAPAVALAVVSAVVLAYAARTFAIRPLVEWDSWAVWTAKARLLYVDPGIAPAALRSGSYGQTPYPLGLPTVEALGFGAMGRYDSTLIGVQFVLLLISFPLALWSLLRDRARPTVVALASLSVVAAPQILYQLLTHYADVPLGLFVGLGLAAGGAWIAAPEGSWWLLVCFAAFLGMAGITKSEGFLFALVGAVALVAVAAASRDGRILRPALLGAGGVLAVTLPWRVYCLAYGLTTADYNLNRVVYVPYLSAHGDRVRPVVRELWRQAADTGKWGLVVWVILAALVAGAAAARWRVLAFALGWLVASAAGLVVLYWASNLGLSSNLTNTSYRTIVSLLVGGAALVPLLVLPPSPVRPSSRESASSR